MNLKKILVCMCVLVFLCFVGACTKQDAYNNYKKAFNQTASVGSLNVEIGLSVGNEVETVHSLGNIKINDDNEMFYEMNVLGQTITQYMKDGVVRIFIDGIEVPVKLEEAVQDDTAEESFDLKTFLAEACKLLEVGKNKFMGLLEPIPSNYVSNIVATENGSDVMYSITVPEQFIKIFVENFFKGGIKEKGIEITDLRDFEYICKQNQEGYLYSIKYTGDVTITVPMDLVETGKEESFDLDVELNLEVVNPGTPVKVQVLE